MKFSFGIACFRTVPEPQILLVKKRFTHAFLDFLMGRYNTKHPTTLTNLFNNMTYSEKRDILSLDFKRVWARVMLNAPDSEQLVRTTNIGDGRLNVRIMGGSEELYQKRATLFDKHFAKDSGKWLRKLMNKTRTVDTAWEIPKGRPETKESPIETACRELKEEAGLVASQYTLYEQHSIVQKFKLGLSYEHKFFLAVIHDPSWEPTLNFDSYVEFLEIENIRWVGLGEFHYLNMDQLCRKRVLEAGLYFFRIMKKIPVVTEPEKVEYQPDSPA
jgi:8-oxo-dGTP pyrophosphatase MutT (NUDIX family)